MVTPVRYAGGMTRPMPPDPLTRRAPLLQAEVVEGLSPAIDRVAERARLSHRFLRHGWYAAALRAYGGTARTLSVTRDGEAAAALPLVAAGPAVLGLVSVPGCYWPFRSFPVAEDAGPEVADALLDTVSRDVRALRLGPVYDGDPGLELLRAAARVRGWAVLDRFVADSYLLDMAALRAGGGWPRSSTLRKNRFHEKHLAGHGALSWEFVQGTGWTDAAFESLAGVEAKSWIAARTDGSDAKFTATGHGAFWRAAAADPVIAGMLSAAVLRIEGVPMAFSFDLNAGALKYAIANSYDPAVGKHSPGKLLYYRNLARAVEEGITHVDWGAGDGGYKRVIGAAPGPAIRDWLFVRPGAPAFAAKLLRGLLTGSGRRRALAGTDGAPRAISPGEDRDL